jgi:hypothetical protein
MLMARALKRGRVVPLQHDSLLLELSTSEISRRCVDQEFILARQSAKSGYVISRKSATQLQPCHLSDGAISRQIKVDRNIDLAEIGSRAANSNGTPTDFNSRETRGAMELVRQGVANEVQMTQVSILPALGSGLRTIRSGIYLIR